MGCGVIFNTNTCQSLYNHWAAGFSNSIQGKWKNWVHIFIVTFFSGDFQGLAVRALHYRVSF